MGNLLIFGLGYTATRIKDAMRARGWRVRATGSAGDIDFADRASVLAALAEASHVLSSVPPDRASGLDPVLDTYGRSFPPAWYGYLSSTGVYGDREGAWVDEATPTIAETGEGRRNARAEADALWVKLGARVFRLPGIYGPGRSALDRVRGREQTVPRVLSWLDRRLTPRPRVLRFGVAHADAPEVAERVRDALVAAYRPRDCFVSLATGVLASHVGPGAWAIFYQVEDGTPARLAERGGGS